MIRNHFYLDRCGRPRAFRNNYDSGNVFNKYSAKFDSQWFNYIDLGTSAIDFDYTDSFSVALWFNPTEMESTDNPIWIGKWYWGGGSATAKGWHFTVRGTSLSGSPVGALNFRMDQAGTSTNSIYHGSNASIIQNPGVFVHALATHDGTLDDYTSIKIYYNGTEVTYGSNSSVSITGTIKSSIKAAIGTCDDAISGVDKTRFAHGLINSAAIWNKVLSSSEVTEIFNSGKPTNLMKLTTEANLVNWWRFGNGDKYPIIRDKKGSSHGTMVNMHNWDFVEKTP